MSDQESIAERVWVLILAATFFCLGFAAGVHSTKTSLKSAELWYMSSTGERLLTCIIQPGAHESIINLKSVTLKTNTLGSVTKVLEFDK